MAEVRSILSGNKEAEFFHEPFGIAHKRFGGCAWPPFIRPRALAELIDCWKPRNEDKFIVQGPWFVFVESALDLMDPIISLLEQKPLTADGYASYDDMREPRLKEAAQKHGIQMPKYNKIYRERCIEWVASQHGVQEVDLLGDSESQRCLVTRVPPWLAPRACVEAQDAQEETGRKAAVFATDPRYLIMKEQKLWDFLNLAGLIMERNGCSIEGPIQKLQGTSFLEGALTANSNIGGGVLSSLGAWALEEVRRPDKVKLFFLEDFLLQPEIAMRSLARFMGVPEQSDVSEWAIREAVSVAHRHGFTGRDDGFGLSEMARTAADFERLFRQLSPGVQDKWEEAVRGWRQLPHPRMASLSNLLCRHAEWDPPMWWASHSASICRPCTFFPRGICRSGEECGFCHGPGHHTARRPSKKERLRRDRRRIQRTPSPPGLSS